MISNKDNLKPLDRNEKVLNLTSEEDLKLIHKAIKNTQQTGIKLSESLISVIKKIN